MAGGTLLDFQGMGFDGVGMVTVWNMAGQVFALDDIKLVSRCCDFPKPPVCPDEDGDTWKVFIVDVNLPSTSTYYKLMSL